MLEKLASALDGLAATELGSLTDGELHERVLGLAAAVTRLQAALADTVAVWDGRQVWAGDGSKAPAARLARDTGWARVAAGALVSRARRLMTMPVTASAFGAAQVTVEHVDVLGGLAAGRFGSFFERDETLLVGLASEMPFAKFKRAVDYWKLRADGELAETGAHRERDGRFLDVARTFANTVDVRGVLDRVDGAIVMNELHRLEQQMFEQDWKQAIADHGDTAGAHHLARTAPQRRADALVEMARRSATMAPGHVMARPLFTVLVGYETVHGPICELFDGTPLTPGQAARYLTEADVERVVFDSRSRVMEVGERRRFFTGALRRAIEVRDRTCTWPGCDEPVDRCEVDHIVEYSNGGLTTLENGRLLCRFHNRQRNRRPELERHNGPAP